MYRIHLIHWKPEEAEARIDQLSSAGFDVSYEDFSRGTIKKLAGDPLDAVVIDLTRMPSQGRDVALNLRKTKGTRGMPLVFAGGDPEKVERIKELLPDAEYTSWEKIGSTLEKAIKDPPADPIVHDSVFAAYTKTPLAKKLGIKTDSIVTLIHAPDGFEDTLGDLPGGVSVRRGPQEGCDLALWFTRSRDELERDIQSMGVFAAKGGLWILWPKKASGVSTDLSQNVVREVGLGSGIVDYKICSVDETWSGLRFTQRKS
ncbi:MAG: DUF3052 family protein [Anaerolineales bacterium]|nr:DUF3052 family protein [Anaerolineales bacterium]